MRLLRPPGGATACRHNLVISSVAKTAKCGGSFNFCFVRLQFVWPPKQH
jgi:hypothetical protein